MSDVICPRCGNRHPGECSRPPAPKARSCIFCGDVERQPGDYGEPGYCCKQLHDECEHPMPPVKRPVVATTPNPWMDD